MERKWPGWEACEITAIQSNLEMARSHTSYLYELELKLCPFQPRVPTTEPSTLNVLSALLGWLNSHLSQGSGSVVLSQRNMIWWIISNQVLLCCYLIFVYSLFYNLQELFIYLYLFKVCIVWTNIKQYRRLNFGNSHQNNINERCFFYKCR